MRYLLLACVLACSQEHTPPPDEETGLVGVTTSEGQLAGTWGLAVEFATVMTLPIVGDRNGGSYGLRLLKRTWDADARVYREQFEWCESEMFEVEGTRTDIPPSVYPKLAKVDFSSEVDHATGAYTGSQVVDIWGARNLPDPATTPLPTHDNYQDPPQSDWMWDEDDDGNPGVTVNFVGTLDSEAFIVARAVYSLDGTVLGVDRVQGLTRMRSVEQNAVEAENPIARGEATNRPDPDATQSWFDSVRLADGATCDDVKAAQRDGRLASRRPF